MSIQPTCICVCVCTPGVSRGQRAPLDPLDKSYGLLGAVEVEVLETELGFCARTAVSKLLSDLSSPNEHMLIQVDD